jgi:hypothetical protein
LHISNGIRFNYYTVAKIAKTALYPLEKCLILDHNRSTWLEPISSDGLLLHAFVFTNQTFLDILAGHRRPVEYPQSSRHFTRTLQLLRERITETGNGDLMVSDPTIMSVVSLTVHAFTAGQYSVAKIHINALANMIKMRGGLTVFDHHPKLQLEFLR